MVRGLVPALVSVSLAGAALALRVTVVDHQAEARRKIQLDPDVLRSPGHDVLRIAALQHAPAWADLLWLQIVQELGKPLENVAASYDRVQRWAHIAVDLDPKYYQVYYASAIHLIVYGKRAAAADELVKRGRRELPERWEFPFLLGYTAYFIHGDAKAAAEYFEAASKLPLSPAFMPSLAGRARFHAGDERGAIRMLEEMLEYFGDGPQREDAEIRLKLLKSEEILRRFDAACKAFEAKMGRRPADGAELANGGWVSDRPFDLLDEPITIDEDCEAHTKYSPVRESKAKERVGSQSKTATAAEDGANVRVRGDGP